MQRKLLIASDGLVPEPPPPSEWRRAPYLGNGDHFWDKVTTYPDSSKSNRPTNTNNTTTTTTTTKPLLLEPEIEVSKTTDHLPASSIPRLLIERGDFPYSFLQYTSTTHTSPPLSDWLIWSQYIVRNERYRDILERAHIYYAVRLFPHLTVQLDQASLAVLLSRWCCHTHTFVASWGEFAPSLEDVSELFYLPVFGKADSDLSVLSAKDQEIVDALRSAATEAAQWGSRFQGSVLLDSPPPCSSKYPTYAQWYRHFFRDYQPISTECRSAQQHVRGSVTGPEYGKRYELAGFLSYWLDRFVFEGKPEDGINQRVFPLAAFLSRGRALPLAPLFLGTLYYRLDMLKQDWVRSHGRYEVATHVSCSFLIFFLYERFPHYAPPPKLFCENFKNDKSQYFGRAMRWTNPTTPCKLGDYIDGFENFCARPYAVKLEGILYPKNCGGPEDAVVLKDDFNFATLKFIAIVCKCSLPYITETGKGAIAYNPDRIACQFGFDQGVPGTTNCQGSYTSSCSTFRYSRELVLRQYPAGFTVPSCKRQGSYTRRFHHYWANILKKLFAFPSTSPPPLEPVPIFEDDISLKAPQKFPNVTRGGFSRFAVAITTTTAAAAQKTFQPIMSARKSVPSKPQEHKSHSKMEPQPPKSKRMRMLSKTYFGSSLNCGADEEQRDPSSAKGGCAADVVEFTSPKPMEIQDSAGDRHLNSEDINVNMPEAENVNVDPASASTADASVPDTSLAPPLPPPREENIGLKKLVKWRSYKCRFRSIPYLDFIFHKHPETFEGFKVKTAYCQRMFLDALASLIKSLAEKSISQITMHDINLARDLMMVCKSVGLDLSWLEERYTDATARLAVRDLNQESARISSELQETNKYATQLRHYLAAKEAKAASLTTRCEELAKEISFQKSLIDPSLSSEDKVLKDFVTQKT